MKRRMWTSIILLNLVNTVFGGQAAEREEFKRLLDYVKVKESSNDKDSEECNCTDPCTPDKRFIDLQYIEAAVNETKQCNSRAPVVCTPVQMSSKYYSMDGSCNNRDHPYRGKSNSCHQRILPHDYSDGVSFPRKSCLKEDLPNARVVSNILHRGKVHLTCNRSIHFIEWGQVIAHDIAYSIPKQLPERGPGSCCEPPRTDEDCIATEVPPHDPFYKGNKSRTCLSFQRTLVCPLCKDGVRQTLNQPTSYHDLSLVYGSDEVVSRALRAGKDGLLLSQDIPGVGPLPPPTMKIDLCEAVNVTHQCLRAGDQRIDQNPMLTTLHIMLFRNHNNICGKLKQLNPHWDDEHLFQEARRINIAMAQYITFGHFIEHELGPSITAQFGLKTQLGKSFTTYEPESDASINNEFADAAFRYAHSMLPNAYLELDPVTDKRHIICLKDFYYWPFEFYKGQLDRLARGMAETRAGNPGRCLRSGLRNWLTDRRQAKEFEGTDMAALTIARGREHGIPGYTYYLKYFFDYDVHSFCDLKRFIPGDTIRKMRNLYKSVHDIDLYTGGLAEYLVEGALVGPTFAALLINQYKAMKFGDSHYFEHGGQSGSFTEEQLVQLRALGKSLFSRILCDTTKISKIQLDAFLPPSPSNKRVPCDSLPKLDLSAWKEKLGKDLV